MDKFFGSKLNTVLLVFLIILMVFALKIMLGDKEKYFNLSNQNEVEEIKLPDQSTSSKILGNKDDLVFFSILPDAKVHGVLSYNGVVKGGYFFEGNIGIAVLDINKKLLKQDHANSTTDWMTAGPVDFKGDIDLSALPKGPAFLEIHNDNASGLPENDKFILIPIVIE